MLTRPESRHYSVAEYAKERGVSPRTVYRAVALGEIPAERCGNRIIIHEPPSTSDIVRDLVERTRAACGLPPTVSDEVVLAAVADIVSSTNRRGDASSDAHRPLPVVAEAGAESHIGRDGGARVRS